MLPSVVSSVPLNLSGTTIREFHRAARDLRRGVITMTGRQPQEPSGDGSAAGPSFEGAEQTRASPTRVDSSAQSTLTTSSSSSGIGAFGSRDGLLINSAELFFDAASTRLVS